MKHRYEGFQPLPAIGCCFLGCGGRLIMVDPENLWFFGSALRRRAVKIFPWRCLMIWESQGRWLQVAKISQAIPAHYVTVHSVYIYVCLHIYIEPPLPERQHHAILLPLILSSSPPQWGSGNSSTLEGHQPPQTFVHVQASGGCYRPIEADRNSEIQQRWSLGFLQPSISKSARHGHRIYTARSGAKRPGLLNQRTCCRFWRLAFLRLIVAGWIYGSNNCAKKQIINIWWKQLVPYFFDGFW